MKRAKSSFCERLGAVHFLQWQKKGSFRRWTVEHHCVPVLRHVNGFSAHQLTPQKNELHPERLLKCLFLTLQKSSFFAIFPLKALLEPCERLSSRPPHQSLSQKLPYQIRGRWTRSSHAYTFDLFPFATIQILDITQMQASDPSCSDIRPLRATLLANPAKDGRRFPSPRVRTRPDLRTIARWENTVPCICPSLLPALSSLTDRIWK